MEISSLTDFAGNSGYTSSSIGTRSTRLTAERSFSVSYGIFSLSAGFAPCATSTTSIVWPSGAARATSAVAIRPLAPGRLSTMTCWPSPSVSLAASRRALVSVAAPGG